MNEKSSHFKIIRETEYCNIMVWPWKDGAHAQLARYKEYAISVSFHHKRHNYVPQNEILNFQINFFCFICIIMVFLMK
jgi:hypothetical protein